MHYVGPDTFHIEHDPVHCRWFPRSADRSVYAGLVVGGHMMLRNLYQLDLVDNTADAQAHVIVP